MQLVIFILKLMKALVKINAFSLVHDIHTGILLARRIIIMLHLCVLKIHYTLSWLYMCIYTCIHVHILVIALTELVSYTVYICLCAVAGEAFCKAAELQLVLGSKHEGATHYVDAGNCYRKGDANGKPVCAQVTFWIISLGLWWVCVVFVFVLFLCLPV